MNIALSGYGKMGHEVEKAATGQGHTIVARLDNASDWDKYEEEVRNADVVIDFSQPNVVVDVIKKCFDMQVPVVTGTTGWYGMLEEMTELCRQKNGTLFYAPNFSIGVNILFKVNETLASLMNRVGGYDVQVKETHHIHKLDKPSGTAISIAEGIIRQMDSLTGWVNDKTDSPSELPVISKRKGEVTGTHTITYNSKADKIVLKHKAKNRSGFALGALAAAAFVKDKKGVYTMDDLLSY
jgi:4-hydroxy-tetrahydrodipicolinate reductase